MLKIWTQGLLNWTQDLNLGIWEKPWVGIHCARNRQTTQDRQGTIKYLDTLAMRKNRQVSCEADKRQDLHGTLARGGVNRGISFDCKIRQDKICPSKFAFQTDGQTGRRTVVL